MNKPVEARGLHVSTGARSARLSVPLRAAGPGLLQKTKHDAVISKKPPFVVIDKVGLL